MSPANRFCQEQEDFAHLQPAVDHVMERFEAVQIIATRRNDIDGETVTVSLGAGNWNARYGMVKRWRLKEESKDEE